MPRIRADLALTEHQEQSRLFAWANLVQRRWPEVGLLFAIPNAGGYKGGFRSNAALVARAKREGVRRGVPDTMLPVARGTRHGLFIEMKRERGGKSTAEQRAWIEALNDQGYRAIICQGWEQARDAILEYLEAA